MCFVLCRPWQKKYIKSNKKCILYIILCKYASYVHHACIPPLSASFEHTVSYSMHAKHLETMFEGLWQCEDNVVRQKKKRKKQDVFAHLHSGYSPQLQLEETTRNKLSGTCRLATLKSKQSKPQATQQIKMGRFKGWKK